MNQHGSEDLEDRCRVLEELVRLSAPIHDIKTRLSQYPWEAERELVLIRPEHVISILRKFSKQAISASDVEDWANLIEGREDVGFESQFEDIGRDVLYELANPQLTRPLTLDLASEWIQRLQQ